MAGYLVSLYVAVDCWDWFQLPCDPEQDKVDTESEQKDEGGKNKFACVGTIWLECPKKFTGFPQYGLDTSSHTTFKVHEDHLPTKLKSSILHLQLFLYTMWPLPKRFLEFAESLHLTGKKKCSLTAFKLLLWIYKTTNKGKKYSFYFLCWYILTSSLQCKLYRLDVFISYS